MPTSIPYDPSLVIGNIVDKDRIEHLEDIANAQKPIDDAQDKLNSLILQKRSLDMTMQEMINMSVGNNELQPLVTQINKLKTDMVSAAIAYSKAAIEGENKIAELKDKGTETKIHVEDESPMDYTKSTLKPMPLSSDSLKMDAQYFRFESNKQDSESHASAIASYVSYQANSIFGVKAGGKIGASVKEAATSQAQNHKIQGTLVITANCTHKQAEVFAPFVLDVDKAIRSWNDYNTKDTIDMDSPKSVGKIASDPKAATEAGMYVLSGATYGSSFVGMVHILQQEDTASSQASIALASSLRAHMEVGSWFANESGELGVDASFANSVKSLLSTSNLQSHCSVITMGLIPTIKANNVTTMVQQLLGDPVKHMEELGAIQGATNTDLTTVATSASAAKDGQTLSTLSTDYMKASVDAVGKMDEQQNQVLDTNSMMTAFDDYIQKAIAGECGVPINFFVKPLTKRQLAKAWVNKYYPGQFNGAGAGDGKPSAGPSAKPETASAKA